MFPENGSLTIYNQDESTPVGPAESSGIQRIKASLRRYDVHHDSRVLISDCQNMSKYSYVCSLSPILLTTSPFGVAGGDYHSFDPKFH